jgi:hypothetical protein
MRTLMIPLALVVMPAFAVRPTNSLFVVVHSIDRVVADYVCSGQFAGTSPDALAFRSVVLSQGSMTWHATGGTAPYRVISDVSNGGGECITVMDADGNTASGCGSINEVHVRRSVDCDSLMESSSSFTYGPQKKRQRPRMPLSVGSPVPGPGPTPGPTTVDPKAPGRVPPPPPPPSPTPGPDPKTPGRVPPPPSPTPGPDPKKPDHVTPVSSPGPGGRPPVPPTLSPSHPPARRNMRGPSRIPHGTTVIHRVSRPTGGGHPFRGTPHTSGHGSNGGVTRTSPSPH